MPEMPDFVVICGLDITQYVSFCVRLACIFIEVYYEYFWYDYMNDYDMIWMIMIWLYEFLYEFILV